MIACFRGAYDVLRAKDLEELDKQIQVAKDKGAECVGLAIYDDNLCEALGLGKPLKNVEERMKIMEQIIGIDFVFKISTLQKDMVDESAKKAYRMYDYYKKLENGKSKVKNKKFKLGYAPGTYDLFHAGHLENLLLAAKDCEKLIVGVKSDELVQEHKNRDPVISADERMEILRHFKFVDGVYKYYVRDPHVALDYIKDRYKEKVEAIYLGSDLKKDFSYIEDVNIVYTPRDDKKMKDRSTTKYRLLYLSNEKNKKYKGEVKQNIKKNKEVDKNEYIDER
mgnify:CR=1 FL=1